MKNVLVLILFFAGFIISCNDNNTDTANDLNCKLDLNGKWELLFDGTSNSVTYDIISKGSSVKLISEYWGGIFTKTTFDGYGNYGRIIHLLIEDKDNFSGYIIWPDDKAPDTFTAKRVK